MMCSGSRANVKSQIILMALYRYVRAAMIPLSMQVPLGWLVLYQK